MHLLQQVVRGHGYPISLPHRRLWLVGARYRAADGRRLWSRCTARNGQPQDSFRASGVLSPGRQPEDRQGHPGRSSAYPACRSHGRHAPPRSAPARRAPPAPPGGSPRQVGDRVLGGHRVGQDCGVHRAASSALQHPGLLEHLPDRVVDRVRAAGLRDPVSLEHQRGRVKLRIGQRHPDGGLPLHVEPDPRRSPGRGNRAVPAPWTFAFIPGNRTLSRQKRLGPAGLSAGPSRTSGEEGQERA